MYWQSPSRTRAQHLAEDLQNEGDSGLLQRECGRVLKPGEVMLIHGAARRGFEYPMQKFVLITETDIFGKRRRKPEEIRSIPVRKSKFCGSFDR